MEPPRSGSPPEPALTQAQSSDACLLLASDVVTEATQAALALLDCTAEQVIGRPLTQVLKWDGPLPGPGYSVVAHRPAPGPGLQRQWVRLSCPGLSGLAPGTCLYVLRPDPGPSEGVVVPPRATADDPTGKGLAALTEGLAHRFNNLLTTILGFAGLARYEAGLPPTVLNCLQQIETSSREAAIVCSQMLAYAGRGRLAVVRTDLSAVVRSQTEHLERLADRDVIGAVPLRFELVEGLPQVRVDPTLVSQAVTNLVSNAIEAVGEGGHVTVRTLMGRLDRVFPAGRLFAADLPTGTYPTVEVADTGMGVSPAVLTRIFEPFFTTKFLGRGLGLSATLGIAQRHGAALEIVSEGQGNGATFRLYFPPDAESLAAAVEEAPASAWRGQGLVLVADDEEGMRQFVSRVLEMHGYRVLLAANGAEAVAQLASAQEPVRLVVLDLTMPVMNGEQALSEVRARWPEVPVLLMSGYHERDVMARFAGRGLAGFLQKPFTPHSLEKAVQVLLGDG